MLWVDLTDSLTAVRLVDMLAEWKVDKLDYRMVEKKAYLSDMKTAAE